MPAKGKPYLKCSGVIFREGGFTRREEGALQREGYVYSAFAYANAEYLSQEASLPRYTDLNAVGIFANSSISASLNL